MSLNQLQLQIENDQDPYVPPSTYLDSDDPSKSQSTKEASTDMNNPQMRVLANLDKERAAYKKNLEEITVKTW